MVRNSFLRRQIFRLREANTKLIWKSLIKCLIERRCSMKSKLTNLPRITLELLKYKNLKIKQILLIPMILTCFLMTRITLRSWLNKLSLINLEKLFKKSYILYGMIRISMHRKSDLGLRRIGKEIKF